MDQRVIILHTVRRTHLWTENNNLTVLPSFLATGRVTLACIAGVKNKQNLIR